MDLLDFLASDNYIPYNRTLAKQIGVENAIIFGALCGYQRHYKQQEFFREQQNIMEDTCLTEYAVRKAIKELKELNLISVTKKGLPAKYYFRINTNILLDMLSTSGYENDTTSNIENTTTSNIENNNTYKNNNKINNNIKERKKNTNYDSIINDQITNNDLKCTLYEFIKMRTLIKKPMTDRALQLLINKLHKLANTPEKAIKILEQSIVHNWQDVYELKQEYVSNIVSKQAKKREYSKEEFDNLFDNIDEINI